MDLCEMGSAQDILRFLPLITIWVALAALPAVGLLGKRRGSPSVVVHRKNLELHTRKLLLLSLSILIHLQDVIPMELCLEVEGRHDGTNFFRPKSGGMKEEGPTTEGQYLDPVLQKLRFSGEPTPH